jgi:hypothetical protein
LRFIIETKEETQGFEVVLRIGHLQVISLMILHIKYQSNNNTFILPTTLSPNPKRFTSITIAFGKIDLE